jgi:hypothetical protein
MDYQQAAPASRKASWTDKISNSMLCNYFYIFFMIFAVWAGLSFLGGIWVFASRKSMTFGMLIALIINIVLSFGISATTALFLYLICDRALKPAMRAAGFEDMAESEDGEEGTVYDEDEDHNVVA